VCAISLEKEVIALLDPINPILNQTKNICMNILLYFDYLGRSSRSFTYDEKAIIEYNTQSQYPKCPTTKNEYSSIQ